MRLTPCTSLMICDAVFCVGISHPTVENELKVMLKILLYQYWVLIVIKAKNEEHTCTTVGSLASCINLGSGRTCIRPRVAARVR